MAGYLSDRTHYVYAVANSARRQFNKQCCANIV